MKNLSILVAVVCITGVCLGGFRGGGLRGRGLLRREAFLINRAIELIENQGLRSVARTLRSMLFSGEICKEVGPSRNDSRIGAIANPPATSRGVGYINVFCHAFNLSPTELASLLIHERWHLIDFAINPGLSIEELECRAYWVQYQFLRRAIARSATSPGDKAAAQAWVDAIDSWYPGFFLHYQLGTRGYPPFTPPLPQPTPYDQYERCMLARSPRIGAKASLFWSDASGALNFRSWNEKTGVLLQSGALSLGVDHINSFRVFNDSAGRVAVVAVGQKIVDSIPVGVLCVAHDSNNDGIPDQLGNVDASESLINPVSLARFQNRWHILDVEREVVVAATDSTGDGLPDTVDTVVISSSSAPDLTAARSILEVDANDVGLVGGNHLAVRSLPMLRPAPSGAWVSLLTDTDGDGAIDSQSARLETANHGVHAPEIVRPIVVGDQSIDTVVAPNRTVSVRVWDPEESDHVAVIGFDMSDASGLATIPLSRPVEAIDSIVLVEIESGMATHPIVPSAEDSYLLAVTPATIDGQHPQTITLSGKFDPTTVSSVMLVRNDFSKIFFRDDANDLEFDVQSCTESEIVISVPVLGDIGPTVRELLVPGVASARPMYVEILP